MILKEVFESEKIKKIAHNIKFDKKLDLVKETEIKIDLEGIQKMMEKMKEKCPMHKKMMQGSGMMGAGEEKVKKDKGASEASEHEAHH